MIRFSSKSFRPSGIQLSKALSTPLAYIVLINGFLLLCLAIGALQDAVPFASLTRDPVATARLPFYTGFFSNLGVLLWCATTTLCLFCSAVLSSTNKKPEIRLFLLYSGYFSLFLTLDDLFHFHESDGFLPSVFHIPENVIYLIYGSLMLGYVVRFHRIILRDKTWPLFALALGLFALSISSDEFLLETLNIPYNWGTLIEDGAKLFGISTWFGYFLTICWNAATWIGAESSGASLRN